MLEDKNFKEILSKIDRYIKKHYLNLILKGVLLSFGIILFFFLLLSLLENFAHFNGNIRSIFLFSYIVFSLGILSYYIFIPISKLLKLSKGIDELKAAKNIGNHFSEIDDKLLNTIQLYNSKNSENQNLIQAILQQRSAEFSKYEFESAVDFKTNKKYLTYFLSPLFIILMLLFISPTTITEPTKRFVNFNKEFIPQAPFDFIILNDSLNTIENEDFTLNIGLKGKELPSELKIELEGKIFRLKKISNTKYNYNFKKLNKSTSFQLIGGDFKSQMFNLNVYPKPAIQDIEIEINYPNYTKIKNEKFKNNGNLNIPEGSEITWKIKTKDTEYINIIIEDSIAEIKSSQNERFNYSKVAKESFEYVLTSSNSKLKGIDSLYYYVNTIKDEYPQIKVEEFKDSLDDRNILFKGFIKDDYGFSNLKLFIKTYSSDNKLIKDSSININFKQNITQQQFFSFFDISTLDNKAGNIINYFIMVWDNDVINGYKSSKSKLMTYKKKRNEQTKNIMNEANKAILEAQMLKKEIKNVQKELQQKKSLEWSDKQRLEELMKKNQQLIENVEKIKKENLEKNQEEKKFKELSDEILEKQKQVEELMEKLLTPELKELMKEMQEMLDKELNKEDAEKLLEKMDFNSEDLEKQLERDLEIMKQLDFEMKLQDIIDKLKNIEKKQDNLSEQTKNKSADNETLKEDQQQLNKEFEDLKEKINEAEESNESLSKPNEMPDTEDMQKEISDEIQKSSDELKNNSNKKSSQHQKNAAQKMKKMSESLENFQSAMSSQQNSENIQTLRQILSNLITTSFMQEELMKKISATSKNDPKYIELIQEQKNIKNNLQITEDSLLALAKRQASISPFINREISNINRNANKVIEDLLSLNTIVTESNNNAKNNANSNQGQIIESTNKLALMLSDVLEKMQQQSMQESNGQCNNPKQGQGSKPSLGDIKKMQQALQKQMEQMKKSQQKGKQKGEGQQSQGAEDGEKMSEEMARMAAQQEMIRRMLQEKQNQLKKEGRGDLAKQLNKVGNMMEENETDLINKILTNESLLRQKEILTRLLESEKAERERDQKEERKAEKAENIERKIPEEFIEYQKLKNKEVELLKTIPLNMKPFYKNKVNEYFEGI